MPGPTPTCSGGNALGDALPQRREQARDIRQDATTREFNFGISAQNNNGDEVRFQKQSTEGGALVNIFPGNFTKGMPHNKYGEISACPPTTTAESNDASNYCQLLVALEDEDPSEFEKVCLGCTNPRRPQRRYENPQAGLAFSLQGADSHAVRLKPAPEVDSVETAAEMAELYWMSLARDIPFSAYESDPLIKAAADDLSSKWSYYFDPKKNHEWQPALNEAAWTNTGPRLLKRHLLFRGNTPADYIGPYMSQFLLRDIPYGAQIISARCRTLLPNDFMTSWENWLDVQNGCDFPQSNCDPVLRLPRNGRDLGQYVHADTVWQAFMNAAFLMLGPRDPVPRCEPVAGIGAPFAAGIPYVNPCAPDEEEALGKSKNQIGFATFGKRHVETLLLQVAQLAVQAVWYQKWSVHRRLRPEAYGGWVHLAKAENLNRYKKIVPQTLRNSNLMERVFDNNAFSNSNLVRNRRSAAELPTSAEPPNQGTYLLPMAFSEGSPMHPAYGSGHSTVAGACGTILKAFFREDWIIPNPVMPDAAGLTVLAYRGLDAGKITIRTEVDKLVSNIGVSRIFAGVHWRSDHTQSIKLGEDIAIRLLRNQACTYNEPFEFVFHRFNGEEVRISAASECPTENTQQVSLTTEKTE